jgi:hypothetical protein
VALARKLVTGRRRSKLELSSSFILVPFCFSLA